MVFASLLEAAKYGDSKSVRALIDAGTDVNFVDDHAWSALMIATFNGHSDVVQMLLDVGADTNLTNERNWSALMYAASIGQRNDIIRMLIKSGSDLNLVNNVKHSALMIAAEYGHTDTVRLLADAGAELNLVGNCNWSTLMFAVKQKHVDLIEILVKAGADLNLICSGCWTPLLLAAREGHSEIVRVLVDGGADCNFGNEETYSPLTVAILYRHVDIVQMLVNAGANVNAMNINGNTPLTCIKQQTTSAVCSGGEVREIVRILIEAGANVNAHDMEGQTALLKATEDNSHEMVEILLQHGAQVDSALLSRAQSEDIRSVLQLYHSSQQFHGKAAAMLAKCSTGSPPSSDQVLDLVPLITSVYDLRLLLTLNSMVDPPNEGKQIDQQTTTLLNAAFGHILSHKLVLDDDACVYFRLVLEYCVDSRLLSPSQFMKWKVQATKVNVESAEWVVELKKHVNENSHRLEVHEQAIGAVVQGIHDLHMEVTEIRSAILDTNDRVKYLQSQVTTGEEVLKSVVGFANQLAGSVNKRLTQCESNIQSVASHLQTFQNGYKQRLEQEDRLRHTKAICGLLASVVGFVFAPMLKTAFDSLVDLTNPIEVFNLAYVETDIVDFLADKSYDELLKPEVQRELEKHAIPTIEFETLLRQGIMVTKPELADECERRGMTLAAVDMRYSKATIALGPSLRQYESKLADTMKELDLVSTILKAETRQSSIKTDFNHPVLTGQMDNSSNCVDPKEWTVKRSSTAAPSKTTDGDTPEETDRHLDKNGRTHTLSDGEVVTFVEDLEALPYHLAVVASHGDLNDFQDLSDVIDDNVECVNAVTEIRRMKQQTQNVTINAAEYAQLLGYRELTSFISSQMGTSASPPTEKQVSVTFLDDIDAFPFLLAVRESEGDVDEFKQWLEMLESKDSEIGNKARAIVSQDKVVDVKMWSPVELACHFGYVNIVKHLLLKKRVKTGERNIAVMIRAKDRAKKLAA